MYQIKMKYRHNGVTTIFEHQAIDCYVINGDLQKHLRLTIPIDALYQYETFDVKATEVEEIVVLREEEILYHSTHWNRILNTNAFFPENGAPQCDVEFAHV